MVQGLLRTRCYKLFVLLTIGSLLPQYFITIAVYLHIVQNKLKLSFKQRRFKARVMTNPRPFARLHACILVQK